VGITYSCVTTRDNSAHSQHRNKHSCTKTHTQNEACCTLFNFSTSFSDDRSIRSALEALCRLFQLIYTNSILAEHSRIANEGFLRLGHWGRVFEPPRRTKEFMSEFYPRVSSPTMRIYNEPNACLGSLAARL